MCASPLWLAVWVGQERSTNQTASSLEPRPEAQEGKLESHINKTRDCPVRHAKGGEGGLLISDL